MTLPVTKTRITPEEYLELEEAAEVKHEYHAGEILAMSGGTYFHSRIAVNTISEISRRLKGSSCFVLESNMRVRLAIADRYVYPDASIVCGEPQFDPRDPKRTTIINPRAIIEVLSDSTEGYDRGRKFDAYRHLASFQEYVLVGQSEALVETYARQADGTWVFAAAKGLEAVARLRSVEIELPLDEVYTGINFTDQRDALPPPT